MRKWINNLPAFAILTFVAPLFAAVLNVPAEYSDIGSALTVAVAGDEVVVAAGIYQEHDLILPSGVVLRGATGDPADVVIDGEQAGRCIYGAGLAATTRLEALTLSNGLPALGSTPHNSWGAGLMVDGGSLTVANCVFTGNKTAIGAGAFLRGTGAPVFVDCIFDGNEAAESVGLGLFTVGDALVQNCIFRNGSMASYGGGLTWGGSGHLLLEDCIVEDNTVFDSGGGVEVIGSNSSATLRNCVIRRNSSGREAGGLFISNNLHVVMDQCEITENNADLVIGGVCLLSGATLEVTESTILNNTSPIGADAWIEPSATAILTCCDIDLDAWEIRGSVTEDNEGCSVLSEVVTWGEIKKMYR